ncbi:MAG: hypothetical protein V1709_06220 [Planctomycetota bacterium]
MNKIEDFRQLKVWQKAHQLVLIRIRQIGRRLSQINADNTRGPAHKLCAGLYSILNICVARRALRSIIKF